MCCAHRCVTSIARYHDDDHTQNFVAVIKFRRRSGAQNFVIAIIAHHHEKIIINALYRSIARLFAPHGPVLAVSGLDHDTKVCIATRTRPCRHDSSEPIHATRRALKGRLHSCILVGAPRTSLRLYMADMPSATIKNDLSNFLDLRINACSPMNDDNNTIANICMPLLIIVLT